MRPDPNSYQSTNSLSTVQFSPRRLLYQRLLGWILRLLLVQTLLSIVIWLGLRVTLVSIDVPGAPPLAWDQHGIGARVSAAMAELTNTASIHEVRLLVFAQ